jgi:hypothetical protein
LRIATIFLNDIDGNVSVIRCSLRSRARFLVTFAICKQNPKISPAALSKLSSGEGLARFRFPRGHPNGLPLLAFGHRRFEELSFGFLILLRSVIAQAPKLENSLGLAAAIESAGGKSARLFIANWANFHSDSLRDVRIDCRWVPFVQRPFLVEDFLSVLPVPFERSQAWAASARGRSRPARQAPEPSPAL